ncbi:MAG: DEAD/DEAH box helicase [Dehalococcoidia bacterium]
MTTFSDIKLIKPILRAVKSEQYTTPTPIQAQAIPPVLDGRDLLGVAQTGTGKTAAFALPILQRLAETPPNRTGRTARCLVVTPTRELAIQIGESFRVYGRHLKLSHTVIFGGVGMNPQVKAMSRGVDVLVATPGRLLDLMNQGYVRLDNIEILVLDEADRMLDMGFIADVRKIVAAAPERRQTLLFSATMPPAIAQLAQGILSRPIKVEVTPAATTVERIDQWVLFVDRPNKRALLGELLESPDIKRALVFTRTKHGANRVVEQLDRRKIHAEAIHGNKSQTARQQALENFRAGRCRVLVATDIAARGIDVDGITHIINYDLPNEPESYVHRIGRTARAGADGVAISFCDASEHAYLRDIEKLIKQPVPVMDDHPYPAKEAPAATKQEPARTAPTRGNGMRRPAPQRSRQQRDGRQNNGSARSNRTSRAHQQSR